MLNFRTPAKQHTSILFGYMLSIFPMLSWAAVSPSPVRADVVYTWHEDDVQGGNPVTGSLVVRSAAQANGQITAPDIVSFGFQSPFSLFQLVGFDTTTLPDPISKVDAGFTGANNVIRSNTTVGTHLSLDTNNMFGVVGGETWIVTGGVTGPVSGVGHWTISGAASAVPEPRSLALACVAAGLFVTAYGWRRWAAGVTSYVLVTPGVSACESGVTRT